MSGGLGPEHNPTKWRKWRETRFHTFTFHFDTANPGIVEEPRLDLPPLEQAAPAPLDMRVAGPLITARAFIP
jgi:hypothetical protein